MYVYTIQRRDSATYLCLQLMQRVHGRLEDFQQRHGQELSLENELAARERGNIELLHEVKHELQPHHVVLD